MGNGYRYNVIVAGGWRLCWTESMVRCGRCYILYITFLYYIALQYCTVQYNKVAAGGGGGELQLQPRGGAAGAGRHRAQVPECSTMQCSTVQYSTVQTVQWVAGAPRSGGSGQRISQIWNMFENYGIVFCSLDWILNLTQERVWADIRKSRGKGWWTLFWSQRAQSSLHGSLV